MTPLELLSPAKNLVCGIAAIDHGADAVYIGAPRFGARASAGNSLEDIRQLCDYAHLFGAKVYVTLNTIVYNHETDDVTLLLEQLEKAGADAILVQDMALLELASRNPKTAMLPLHASTQTDNRTAEKVAWLYQAGFDRAVLARELSIAEIADIHHQVPEMELEVFVHGALCVSYSGQCYASQHCFHRSANRGECAQFCRMPFSLVDAQGEELIHDRYLLSLKDMNQYANLERLALAGATSFKIEGRLKDVSYVKNVTAAYSEQLNRLVRRYPDRFFRASLGHCDYTFQPNLDRTFNRGYTTYFAKGRQKGISSFDTPKAIGAFVGTVKELRPDSFNVAGSASFSNGDGLCFMGKDRRLEGLRANRVVGNRIYPYKMPAGLKAGMALYRNNDQEMERMLTKPSAVRKIPLRLSLNPTLQGFELQGIMGNVTRSVSVDCQHQEAQKSPIENIKRQLSKLGDTPYECEAVNVDAGFMYFIPNSVLSELRRTLVEALKQAFLPMRKQRRSAPEGLLNQNQGRKDGLSYEYNYLYNISNRLSQSFYQADDCSAYELKGGDGPIMQCRYCLRYALGYCVRQGGEKPVWKEPLVLRLADGRRFPLEFDCKHCQMNVYAETP